MKSFNKFILEKKNPSKDSSGSLSSGEKNRIKADKDKITRLTISGEGESDKIIDDLKKSNTKGDTPTNRKNPRKRRGRLSITGDIPKDKRTVQPNADRTINNRIKDAQGTAPSETFSTDPQTRRKNVNKPGIVRDTKTGETLTYGKGSPSPNKSSQSSNSYFSDLDDSTAKKYPKTDDSKFTSENNPEPKKTKNKVTERPSKNPSSKKPPSGTIRKYTRNQKIRLTGAAEKILGDMKAAKKLETRMAKAIDKSNKPGTYSDKVNQVIKAKPLKGTPKATVIKPDPTPPTPVKKPKAVKQSEVSKTISKQNKAYNLKRNLVKDRKARRNVGSAFKKTIENAKRTFGLVSDKAKKDIKLTKDIVNLGRDINRKPPTTPTTPKLPSSTTSATPKLPSSTTTPKGTSALVKTPKTPKTPKTTVIPAPKTPKTPKPKTNWLKNLLNPKAADQVVDVTSTSVKAPKIKAPKPPTPSSLNSFKNFTKTAGYTPTKTGFKTPKPTLTSIKPNPKLTDKVKTAFDKTATKTSSKVAQQVGKKGFKAFARTALKTLNPVVRVAGYAADVGDAYKDTRAKGGSRARGIAKGIVKAAAYPAGWALGTAGGAWTGPGAFVTGMAGAELASAAAGKTFDKIAGPTKLQKAQASLEKQKQELKKKQKTTTTGGSGNPGLGMGLLKPMPKKYQTSGINISQEPTNKK